MNVTTITSACLAAIIGFTLATPATVLAGDRHHERHGYSQHDGRHYKHQQRHYKRHRKQHNRNGHGYGHRGHGNNYYRHDDDSDEKLLIGLVVGGILGYAINNANHQNDISYDRDYGRPARNRDVYPATDSYRQNDRSCLQEREYQTTVIVGGREVDAYGTACLQPDGSWKRSPAQVAAY